MRTIRLKTFYTLAGLNYNHGNYILSKKYANLIFYHNKKRYIYKDTAIKFVTNYHWRLSEPLDEIIKRIEEY